MIYLQFSRLKKQKSQPTIKSATICDIGGNYGFRIADLWLMIYLRFFSIKITKNPNQQKSAAICDICGNYGFRMGKH